jgi:hypothetical protein
VHEAVRGTTHEYEPHYQYDHPSDYERVIRKGIDSGMNAGSNMMSKRRGKQPPQGEIDDYGNPTGRDNRR